MFVGLVCFIVIYFFYGGPPRQPEHIAQSFRNAIKNQACAKLVLDTDCVENPSNILVEYDANNDGEINQSDNLQTLAENFYDCEELECVKRICECPGY